MVVGFAATARADFSTMPVLSEEEIIQSNASEFQGVLDFGTDGNLYLASEFGFSKIVSNSDLSEFAGLNVEIVAVDISKRNGAVNLPFSSKRVKQPLLLVLEIREL